MEAEFTAIFCKVAGGYVAFTEELPGANSQGSTLEETRAKLRDAVQLVLRANRGWTNEQLEGAEILREPIRVIA